MSNPLPDFQNSPGFVPPSAPIKKSGPSGCAWVGMSCLVVFILFAVLLIVGYVGFKKSPGGSSFMKSVSGIMASGKKLPQATEKMSEVVSAIERYHTRNGKYPDKLQQLLPEYLLSKDYLHADTDPNPDPNHISFTYSKPKEGQDSHIPVLSMVWKNEIDIDADNKEVLETSYTMGIDGNLVPGQSVVTMYGADGKIKARTVSNPRGHSSSVMPFSAPPPAH